MAITPKHKGKISIERLLKECITHETPILPETHICKIGGTNFMTNGEISFISGLPKTGKSTIVSFVLATALMKEIREDLDTLKIRTDYTTKNIVYLDTEQSISGTASTLMRVLKLAGLKECPPNLKYFNIRMYDIEERKEILETICKELPNIAFIVVDGISDFLTGVNDELASNEMIAILMHYSSLLDIPILSILHETYGGKMRGQFGSQGERKCSGAISIKKDRENKCFMIVPKFIRYGADFDDIYYQYNATTEMIECLDFDRIQEIKKGAKDKTDKTKELKEILEKVFAGTSEGIEGKELKKRIAQFQTNKEGSSADAKKGLARRNLTSMMELKLMYLDDNDIYFYECENKDLFNLNEQQKPTF